MKISEVALVAVCIYVSVVLLVCCVGVLVCGNPRLLRFEPYVDKLYRLLTLGLLP